MSDARTPTEIEADIKRRREQLAATLDEIGVRVHPSTLVGDAKARFVGTVDQTLGRAYVGVNRALTDVKERFTDEDGAPRMERVVPAALLVVGVVGLLRMSARRKRH
ncbi:DUF3618 domain-containing protein [Streptomyces sp. O3]